MVTFGVHKLLRTRLTRLFARAFYFQVPMTMLAFLSASLALQTGYTPSDETLKSKIRKVDFLGSGVLVCAVFCLLLGLESGVDTSYASPEVISLLIGSFTLFATFIFVEARVSIEPLAPLRIVVNNSLIAAFLATFFAFAGGLSSIFNLSLYFQAIEKLNAKQTGLSLLPGVVAGVSGSLVGGLIMQKTGKYYRLTATSYTIMLLGQVIICASTGLLLHSLIANYIGVLQSNPSFGYAHDLARSLRREFGKW